MDTNFIKNIIRIGRVSSIDVNTNTARVAFSDKDDLVSGNLMICKSWKHGRQGLLDT